MIETYILEHLAAVARYGTFSKVAEALNTSQPAVTRSMQKIEDELGVTLFERGKNKIALNELGLEAARYAQKILDLHATMITTIKEIDQRSRTFSFASPAPAPIKELTPLITQLYGETEISAELRSMNEILPLLTKKEIEFAVTLQPQRGKEFFCVPFMKENLAVLLPRTHRLADRVLSGLRLKDLAGETFLMFNAVGFWHDVVTDEIPDAQFIIQNEYGTLGTLIDTSSLPSFITNVTRSWRSLPTDRVIVPLKDDCVHVTYYAVFRVQDRWKHEALITALESLFASYSKESGTSH